jgi:alkylhydroperoxidase family enzyme
MAYIPYIEEEIAPEQLRAIYDRHRDPNGHVDNILKIHGPNPPSLEAHAKLYVTLMRGKSELTRAQREMIAVVVSSINECHY